MKGAFAGREREGKVDVGELSEDDGRIKVGFEMSRDRGIRGREREKSR